MSDRIRDVSSALLDVFCIAKSDAFEDERETRVVCLTTNTRLWNFRSGNFGITPYVGLGAADSWDDPSKGTDPLPIRAIRLSANASDADIFAVNALLEINGFAGGVEAERRLGRFRSYPIGGGYREIEPPVRISKSVQLTKILIAATKSA